METLKELSDQITKAMELMLSRVHTEFDNEASFSAEEINQITDNMRVIFSALADAERERDELRAKLAEAVKVMSDLVGGLVTDDEEGLIEHVPQVVAARDFLASMKGGE